MSVLCYDGAMGTNSLLPLTALALAGDVGGKAFALGEMLKAGFKVPEGFVITSKFPAQVEELEAQILASFDSLNSEYVAVRSSALHEDSQGASWAGQLDTFLNVDREHLLEYIQKCQRSADSERAKSYAKQQRLPSGSVAVIVQQMIQSEVSGVAFSVHPVTKNRGQIVIEAAFGLGEAVVSGEVTPDTYITDKATNKILEKHVTAQSKKLAQAASGQSAWQPLNKALQEQKLSDEQILELAKLIAKIEAFYSFPVDVEWGLVGNEFYILQCRPITTLG